MGNSKSKPVSPIKPPSPPKNQRYDTSYFNQIGDNHTTSMQQSSATLSSTTSNYSPSIIPVIQSTPVYQMVKPNIPTLESLDPTTTVSQPISFMASSAPSTMISPITTMSSVNLTIKSEIQSPNPNPNTHRLDMTNLVKSTGKHNRKSSHINPKSGFVALDLEEVPYWKNECQVDIEKINYVWIFSSFNQKGWWYMSPKVNDHVEKLYQQALSGEDISDVNHLRIHNGDFKYDFEKMCQINRITNTNRTIRRLDMNIIRTIENNYNEHMKKLDYAWKYRAGKIYVPFMPKYQEELEAAYQDYNNYPDVPSYVHYNFKYDNGYDYQVNFQKMTQLNRQTNVKRNIVRTRNVLVTEPELEVKRQLDFSELNVDNVQTINNSDLGITQIKAPFKPRPPTTQAPNIQSILSPIRPLSPKQPLSSIQILTSSPTQNLVKSDEFNSMSSLNNNDNSLIMTMDHLPIIMDKKTEDILETKLLDNEKKKKKKKKNKKKKTKTSSSTKDGDTIMSMPDYKQPMKKDDNAMITPLLSDVSVNMQSIQLSIPDAPINNVLVDSMIVNADDTVLSYHNEKLD